MISISIIIPVYNVQPYVRCCLESVMNQNCSSADVECIIVDDCGKDESMTIVREMLSAYEGAIHFRIVQHEHNSGISSARNTGCHVAKGDYVIFIDSDDYLLDGALALMTKKLGEYPESDVVVGNVKVGKNDSSMMMWITDDVYIDNRNTILCEMLNMHIYRQSFNKLIRRSLLVKFDSQLSYQEDVLWSYLLFKKVSSVLLLKQDTYYYRFNASSIVNNYVSQVNVDKTLASLNSLANKLLDAPVAPGFSRNNITVDYLLMVSGVLMQGYDVCFNNQHTSENLVNYRKVRLRFFRCIIGNGYIIIFLFSIMLIAPFNYLTKIPYVRHNYFNMERIVSKLSHLFDFLHRIRS